MMFLNRKHFEAILIAAVIIVGAISVQWIMQPEEDVLFTYSEQDVSPYPHYYSTEITIEAREEKDSYLRVSFEYRGIPSDINFGTTHEVWNITLDDFNKYYDPTNETAMDLFEWKRGNGRSGSTVNRIYDWLWEDNPIEPGNYVFIQYFEIYDETEEIVADSLSLYVSVIYL
ncbi:hypothetical protein EU537_08295 [Candidatus Thorarchaeota archaeon]|nr:MAG: hypothetical protein EU537_08295 [Candidatus Thorarchaeota archaeon]